MTTEEIQDAHSMFYITHSHETRLKSHLQTDAIYAMLKIFLLIHLRLMIINIYKFRNLKLAQRPKQSQLLGPFPQAGKTRQVAFVAIEAEKALSVKRAR